jgi:hypothetical protein
MLAPCGSPPGQRHGRWGYLLRVTGQVHYAQDKGDVKRLRRHWEPRDSLMSVGGFVPRRCTMARPADTPTKAGTGHPSASYIAVNPSSLWDIESPGSIRNQP